MPLTERGTDTFAWDAEDRLVEAEVDSVTTTFEYHGDGLRDSATVGMSTTTYTWDIAGGLPVVLQENSVRYIWGAHGLIAQVDATPDWHYYHADGLGSTLAITDDVGAVEQTYEYDVYGAVTGGSGSLENSFQFAGEQVDGSTGLQYLRARYYDMDAGLFLSRDPLSSIPGWGGSPFGYANARPTNLTDPLGLCPRFTPDALCDAGSAIKDGASAGADAVANCATDLKCSATVAGLAGGVAATVGVCAVTAGAGCPAAAAGLSQYAGAVLLAGGIGVSVGSAAVLTSIAAGECAQSSDPAACATAVLTGASTVLGAGIVSNAVRLIRLGLGITNGIVTTADRQFSPSDSSSSLSEKRATVRFSLARVGRRVFG